MHKYFRAVGFSEPMKPLDRDNLIDDVINKASSRAHISLDSDSDEMLSELRLDFGDGYGAAVVGTFDGEDHFECEYLYPYLAGSMISSLEEITVEEQIQGDTFAGVVDDLNIGSTLIFRVLNGIDFVKSGFVQRKAIPMSSVRLSALSINGKILFPIAKSNSEMATIHNEERAKKVLLNRARNGDEEAARSLSMMEMETFSVVMNSLDTEDIYSLVDNTFMPTGYECDLYSVLGDIESSRETINPYTLDKIWIMTINCNGLQFELCINDKDLLGDPTPGMRFKGIVWMQGIVGFSYSDFPN